MTLSFSVPPAEFSIKRSSYSQHRMSSFSVLIESSLQNASFYHSLHNALTGFLGKQSMTDLHYKELLQGPETPYYTGLPLPCNLIADGCISRLWIG